MGSPFFYYLSPLVKILPLEKVQIYFGFFLVYSYLCPHDRDKKG